MCRSPDEVTDIFKRRFPGFYMATVINHSYKSDTWWSCLSLGFPSAAIILPRNEIKPVVKDGGTAKKKKNNHHHPALWCWKGRVTVCRKGWTTALITSWCLLHKTDVSSRRNMLCYKQEIVLSWKLIMTKQSKNSKPFLEEVTHGVTIILIIMGKYYIWLPSIFTTSSSVF